MRPRSPAPPRRAGAAPGQGRAGWVGTGPASPPRRRRASSGRCGHPALPPLRRGGGGASAPSGPPRLPQAPHFPGLLASRSVSPPSQPPHLLPTLRVSTSFPTLSPARSPPPPCTRRERAVTPGPRCTPRGAGGAGLGGGGASRAVCCPARARAAPVSGAAGADQVFLSRSPPLPPSRWHCYLRVPKDWFL